MPKQSTKGTVIRIGLSIALMAIYCFFWVDLSSTWRHLAGADWSYLGLLAIWITLDRMLMAYKWLLLVRCRGVALSFSKSLCSYYLATFVGTFLPTTVGADAVRVGAVSGVKRPSSLVTASIVMERALGFVAATVAAMAALALMFWLAGRLPTRTFDITLALLVLSVGGLFLSISVWVGRLLQKLVEAIQRKAGRWAWLNKALDWSDKVLGAYGEYRRHGVSLFIFLLLSLLEQTAPVVGVWLAAMAMRIDLGLLQTAAVAPLALLCSRVPLSVAGFGVIEGFYMIFFPMVGVSLSDSFLLGLIGDISVMVSTLPGGLILALSGFKLRDSSS